MPNKKKLISALATHNAHWRQSNTVLGEQNYQQFLRIMELERQEEDDKEQITQLQQQLTVKVALIQGQQMILIILHEQIATIKKQLSQALAKISSKPTQIITHIWFYLKLGSDGLIKFGKAVKEASIDTRYVFMKFDRSYKMRIPMSALLAATPTTPTSHASTSSRSHFDQHLIIDKLLKKRINPRTQQPYPPLINLIHGHEWMRTTDTNAADPQIVLLQFGKRMERANIPEGEAGGKALLAFAAVLDAELDQLYEEMASQA